MIINTITNKHFYTAKIKSPPIIIKFATNFYSMKIRTIFLLIIAATISFSSCTLQEISVGKPQDVKVDNISLNGIKISGKIPVNNPNNLGFNINKAKLDIYLNGISIGSLNKHERIHIKPNSNDAYTINYEASFKEIVKDPLALKSAILQGSPTLKLSGYVKASKFIISKKIKVEHQENISKLKLF